jgi:uncharacterized membrane protein
MCYNANCKNIDIVFAALEHIMPGCMLVCFDGERRSSSMRNPVLLYIVILVGIIGLGVGIYYLTANHPARAVAGIVVGAILLVAGVVGLFRTRARPRL